MAPVDDHGDAERAALAPCTVLRDEHPPDRMGPPGLVTLLDEARQLGFARSGEQDLPVQPVVFRPALTSVIRRMLTSVLLKLRSISFCRFLTLARSSSFDAVKMRWRSRRTFCCARSQLMLSQSAKKPLSGPFTPAEAGRPTCPLVLPLASIRPSGLALAFRPPGWNSVIPIAARRCPGARGLEAAAGEYSAAAAV
jgi:hypothetical protein